MQKVKNPNTDFPVLRSSPMPRCQSWSEKPVDNSPQDRSDRKQHRCRHNNSGYCKMEADYVHFHSEKMSEQFLMNGKCEESKQCIDRHPKECKFWLNDPQGCLRGDICKYLHRTENKGTKVKDPERTSNNSEASRFKTTPAKKTLQKMTLSFS